jgi:hypothetical protein
VGIAGPGHQERGERVIMDYKALMIKARKANAGGLDEIDKNSLPCAKNESCAVFRKALKQAIEYRLLHGDGDSCYLLNPRPVSGCSPDMQLRTAMMFIACGIKTNDWDCVADGLAMLEAVHEQMTGRQYQVD